MKFFTIPCDKRNYGGLRAGKIRYIVVHYTAGDGDTAIDNGLYFSRNAVGASAHYFVDETSCVTSVEPNHVAWHCGGSSYKHPWCRNSNSVGVEMVSRKDADGRYYFTTDTIHNGVEMVRTLMNRYGIDADHVVRHYDVTGKICPAPFVGEGVEDWKVFKRMISEKRYNKVSECPHWAQPTIQKLTDSKALGGDSKGNLNLSEDMMRVFVVHDRKGLYDKEG